MPEPKGKLEDFVKALRDTIDDAVVRSPEVQAMFRALVEAGHTKTEIVVELHFDMTEIAKDPDLDPPEPDFPVVPGDPLTEYNLDFSELEWLQELPVGDPQQN